MGQRLNYKCEKRGWALPNPNVGIALPGKRGRGNKVVVIVQPTFSKNDNENASEESLDIETHLETSNNENAFPESLFDNQKIFETLSCYNCNKLCSRFFNE